MGTEKKWETEADKHIRNIKECMLGMTDSAFAIKNGCEGHGEVSMDMIETIIDGVIRITGQWALDIKKIKGLESED